MSKRASSQKMKQITQVKISPPVAKEDIDNAMAGWFYLSPEHEVMPWKAKFATFEEYMEWWGMAAGRQLFVDHPGKDITVSTVFLGLDHMLWCVNSRETALAVFETMVFGGPNDGRMARYKDYEEAKAGHEQITKEQPSGISRADFEKGADIIRKLMGEL